MVKIYCLIDYYNLDGLPHGKNTKFLDHSIVVSNLINRIIKWIECNIKDDIEIEYLFYGGWISDGGLRTNDRDILATIARKYFPSRTGRIRSISRIMEAPYGYPDIVFRSTIREKDGLPYFYIREKEYEKCDHDDCTIPAILSWRKGRCFHVGKCDKKSNDIFYQRQQKLVDSMIVADTITLSYETKDKIMVVSNDDDIIPSFFSARISTRGYWVRVNRKNDSIYEDMLLENGIVIIDL